MVVYQLSSEPPSFFGIVIKNWNAQKPWKLDNFWMFHHIFLPSPAHVSINVWGCQSSSLELGMQVWLRNPAYFFCSKHFCTESAKRKKARPKRPANIPQKSAKHPQKHANARKSRKQGFWFVFTHSSFLQGIEIKSSQYRSQKSHPRKQAGVTWI